MIYKEMVYTDLHDPQILLEDKIFGYNFKIISNGTHPCAYVKIPENHPCFGKYYDELSFINVHGGLTYSSDHYPQNKPNESEWWIGWDYAHAGDYLGSITNPDRIAIGDFCGDKKWTVGEILKDVESVIEQLEKIKEEELDTKTNEEERSVTPFKVYIAGPISGVPNYKENFERAEKFLNSLGFETVNPAVLSEDTDYRTCINEGLKKLMQCDAIFLLRGYENSKGARLEDDYAHLVDIPRVGETGRALDLMRLKEKADERRK